MTDVVYLLSIIKSNIGQKILNVTNAELSASNSYTTHTIFVVAMYKSFMVGKEINYYTLKMFFF